MSGTLARDSFSRTLATTWGTADMGGAWVRNNGADADYEVDGSRGLMRFTATSQVRGQRLPVAHWAVVADWSFAVSALTATGVWEAGVRARVNAGATDAVSLRVLVTSAGVVQTNVQRIVANATTTIASTQSVAGFPTLAPGDRVRGRAILVGPRVRLWVWPDGQPMPAQATREVIDALLPVAGTQVMLLGSCTGDPGTSSMSWDDVRLSRPGSRVIDARRPGVVRVSL